jgi:hypothetical protein
LWIRRTVRQRTLIGHRKGNLSLKCCHYVDNAVKLWTSMPRARKSDQI